MSSSTGTDISQCLQVLVPTLANVFKCHFKKIWLENCPTRFKPVLYRIYVDDTFLLFRATKHVEKSKKYLKKRLKNIAVTSEIEENYSLSFLDVKISREKNKNVTSVFRKHTFSGIFTNFESFIFKFYKCSLIDTFHTADLVYAQIWKSFMRKLVLSNQSSKAVSTPRTSSTMN